MNEWADHSPFTAIRVGEAALPAPRVDPASAANGAQQARDLGLAASATASSRSSCRSSVNSFKTFCEVISAH